MLIALASTAAVVLSDDPQMLRLAVVGALWAFVLAAFAAPRRREREPTARPGSAIELRRTYEIELEKEVAARREYELQLEVYLRRELERGLAEDVAALRDEVGRMRGEMIDRLDGELRMERIETTRLIGGSLRALQDEARRLGIGVPVPAELTRPADLRLPAASAAADHRPPSDFQGGYPAPSVFGEPAPAASYGGTAGPTRPTPSYPSYAGPGPAFPPAAAQHRLRARRACPGPRTPPPRPCRRPPHHRPRRRRTRRATVVPAAARAQSAATPGESVAPRRRRAREDGEDNEVMSRLLGR